MMACEKWLTRIFHRYSKKNPILRYGSSFEQKFAELVQNNSIGANHPLSPIEKTRFFLDYLNTIEGINIALRRLTI